MTTHLVVQCTGCWKAPYPHAAVIRVDDPNNRVVLYKAESFSDACKYAKSVNETAWSIFKAKYPDAVRGDI